MPKKKYKVKHINFDEEQEYSMNELGGPTEGFRKLYAFWYANYELFEEQEKRRISIREKVKQLK